MLKLRALAVFALMTGIVLAAGARLGGQPGGGKGGQPTKVTPVPLVVSLLPYIGNEDLHKELNLSPDQARKLLDHRQKQWDELFNNAPDLAATAERNKATVAVFAEVLKPEQLKRAHQIAAQMAWSPPGFAATAKGAPPAEIDYRAIPGALLQRHPELATALKLSDTQTKLASVSTKTGKTKSADGFVTTTGAVLLTPDQVAAAKEWLGARYTGKMTADRDTRPGLGGGFRAMPVELEYTEAKDVRKDIGLTDEKAAELAKVRAKWNATFGGGAQTPALSPAARQKAEEHLLAETEKELARLLTADQRKRLAQIGRQQATPAAIFRADSPIGKELGITEAQQKQYTALVAAHGETVAKAVLSDDPLDTARAAVQAAAADRNAAIDKLYTAAQQAKKNELFGAPFKGTTFPDDRGGGGGGGGLNVAAIRELSFGRYAGELFWLQPEGVRKELKLTDEQVKKVAAAYAELNSKFPRQGVGTTTTEEERRTIDKQYADQSAFEKKALEDILDKDQQARYRQLRIQLFASDIFGGRTSTGAAGYPGVAEAIKLTPEQKKRLIDGDAPADVLTPEQQKAIKDMMGTEVVVAQVFTQPGGGSFPNPITPLRRDIALALNLRFWDVVKVTPEQAAQLVEPINAYRLATASRPFGGPPGATPDPKGPDAAAELTKAVEKVLKPDQLKRLGELALQSAAANSLAAALVGPTRPAATAAVPEAGKQLALTEAQAKAIRDKVTEFTARAQLVSPAVLPAARRNEVGLTLREKLDSQIVAVLTPEQQAKWKELTGTPYEGFTKSPLTGGFGGGGFPGGGGGFVPPSER